MVRRPYLALLLLIGCASGGKAESTGDDAALPDDDACTPQTYFADLDQDGHGDPAGSMVACVQPANTVTISDDCDDGDASRFPGNPEVCDGVDNDCDAATTNEGCPANCTVQKRPPPDNARTYLFCLTSTAWVNARSICNTAGFKLAQIDDAAENSFIRSTANTLLGGVDLHIGGSDFTENVWLWDGGDQFWQGTGGGIPINNHFENWAPGEPNDDGTEDCAEMRAGADWNDGNCNDAQRFVCRK